MLRAGRCAMALAGGVSLLLHPQKLIATSQEHFTTKTAEVIRGYGLGADGTILGEGVGALVLKRLGDAKRDGDHIYGVIRGTAISNAGIRNGFTVPNPHQQAAAIERALDDAGVSAGTITYVEGHGSGTALGDPIEVRALTQAWRKHTDAVQACPIGTVKSNVAHLLAASGLAGIAKVLMQMKHGQLAPSLHAETLNPNIAFDKTPFFVQRELAPWRRLIDQDGAEIPRRAGVTSIGAGGMNSHMVIEEWREPPAEPVPAEPQLLVFSAMTEAGLVQVVERFLAHLAEHPEQALADLAYTLQVGRNQLPCRLALVATDAAQAAERLRAFVAAPGAAPGRWYTRSILDHDPIPPTEPRDPAALAAAWISGAMVDWDELHRNRRPRRLSLPAYPFERVRCWYPEQPDAPSVVNPLGSKLKLHPLVGRNVSDLSGLAYVTDLHLSEVLDYGFKRDRIPALLPTTAIEMVAALARIAGLEGPLNVAGLRMTEPAWPQARQLTANVSPDLAIRVAVDGTEWIAATVTSGAISPPAPTLTGGETVTDFYGMLRGRGFDFLPYGETVEAARRLPGGGLLCTLRAAPPQQDHYKSRVQLPAAALAAAYQALALLGGEQMAAIERISLNTAGSVAQVLAQPQGGNRFALWFLDASGAVLAHVDGLGAAAATIVEAKTPDSSAPTPGLADDLRAITAELLKFPPDRIGLRDAFHDLGFDSISLTRLADAISTAYSISLSPAVFFEAEHLEALAAHLTARHAVAAKPRAAQPARAPQSVVRAAPSPRPARDAIAIIGMAGRFPGAADADSLFDRLLAGDDLTAPIPTDGLRDGPWRGGFLTDIDRFDAALFRVSPVEAERMDPQQRLMLEAAWRTLENAGYGPDELPSDTAVMVGASALDYAALLRRAGIAADGYGATGNSLAMIANRVSFFFNLHGPSETVDTACSSSLVALLRAAEALKRGTCSAALVGGVNLMLAPEGFEGPAQAGMLSPDGRCKSFGASADGYGRGEGVAMVLLKRLADAERDGDRILGVLIGGAENHGGRAGSLTAPSVAAQAELVQTALAGIDPRSVSYIETHGTGTVLGDPVEVNGLRRAYEALMGSETVPAPFVALGTVKSNIGHLEAAAGLAGLVKVLGAMARGVLPASLHCTPPNPHLELAGSPFRLLAQAEPWPAGAGPRRAGISSFGFGGSNAHVVVEDYRPTMEPRRRPLPPRAFAATRFWLPGTTTDTTVIVTPGWVEAPAATGRTAAHRVVVAAETLPERYEDAASALLDILRGQSGDVLVQLVAPVGDERAGLGGMLDSAALERPSLDVQVVETEPGLSSEALAADAADPATRIRHRNGRRFVRGWSEMASGDGAQWRPRGVFLITGGTGGLGRLLARDIARNAPGAVLVLTGSKPEDSDRAALVAELRSLGAVAAYRQVEMADAQAVIALVRGIVEVHGALHMVLHCAGTLRDGLIRGKSAADLATVLAPKVAGTRALMEACAGLDLDALVLFSSLAGAIGNVGQSDYAAANGFMDALAEARGLPLVAVNWPLWAEGGMRADQSVQDALFARMGQRPLATADGLAALRRILAAKVSRAAVVAGDAARIRAFFAAAEPAPVTASGNDRLSAAVTTQLSAAVTTRLRGLFAEASGFAASAIHATTPLEEYGIDSLMITRLNAALGDGLGALPKTLFFQYRTLAEVAGALTRDHAEACRRWTGLDAAPAVLAAPAVTASRAPMNAGEPIAIIGIAGRYPGADDLAGFWDNLATGHDAVDEVPAERWSLDNFFHPDRDEAAARGLSYAKWGAFLDGFADFDPLFFKISPRDAAAMDPQERLFLMCAWAAAEDAGYSPARLGAANPVGVFVGVTKTGFALHGPFAAEGGAMVRPNTSFASVANRVSHVLNLTGPSLPVDTMCSSSATALHEACEHLRSGAAGMALAGGVNLYLHPSTFIELSAARMLSPDGRCRSFGAGANGFVPGEGVGCVVLKPLSRALADGDRIHAVIRASAINHGGHTNGYTVPNPAAQRDLVRAALDRAGLGADTVTCIEAHGTGTELGDPIEVEGLTQAFRANTTARGFCALGSVKSNIGHLEAAAGIAALTKVVLALRHRALPPTLHADTVNPNLDLESSPFTLQRRLAPWNPPGKRIAGISSFGAGGANAHLIVEEAPPATPATTIAGPQAIVLSARDADGLRRQAERLLRVVAAPAAPAGLAEDLRAELARLLDVSPTDMDGAEPFDSLGLDPAQRLALRGWLESRLARAVDAVAFAHLTCLDQIVAHVGGDGPAAPALADIAFTLQVGREAMEHRLALVADSLPALADAVRRWLAGDGSAVLTGQSGQHRDILDDAAALADLAARWWEQGELSKLLSLWVKGLAVDWAALPRRQRPAIVSLPTYPFACRRFWLPIAETPTAPITAPAGDAALEQQAARLDRAIGAILAATLRDTPDTIPALARWRTAAEDLLAGDPIPAGDPWAAWEDLRRNGGPTAQMALAEATLRALPDILTGKRPATSVMFPDGALGLVEATYKDNPVAARFSSNLAQAAAAFVRASPLQSLRILEIGAGTGGTSERVFEALAPHAGRVAEYRYTDLSRAFLIHAERAYGPRWPQLTTALFDVEKPVAGQDVVPGGYEMVIAANVLHATADMARTLDHVRQLLAPGGVLLINETSRATLFTHVTFGLLEGWWRFTDPARRIPGTPSLTPQSWRTLLDGAGLDWLAGSSATECALGQQLIAARLPGVAVEQAPTPIARPAATPMQAVTGNSLRERLLAVLGETLNVAPATILPERSFADYGLDSILGAELVHKLRRTLGVELDHTALFDHTNVAQLEAFLAQQVPAPVVAAPAIIQPAAERQPIAQPASRHQPIAIVGYSGRFAKSPDAEALWAHLMAGDDLVEPVSRFDLGPLYRDAAPGTYGRHGSFIDGIENFDPVFFGISGLEATYMDPQQRLFLEEAWKTLDHAGHAGEAIHGRRVGVFAGCSSGDYHELFGAKAPGQAFWGNTCSLIPARIAYFLDLKGPAVAVDTACSSSLVAVHMACQSLWNGESDMALAGGVFVQCTPRFYRSANQANMLSPSGRCAAFGAGADGIVPGEAVGAVLLRPLADALADGDTVHGVIVASGLNQDGTTNGITAPSAASQERLIRSVYAQFAIDPASIGMVEAHGTGTPLGDPIEHAALARAFGPGKPGSVALGSVKSNIGHATTAAGIAGLIKVLLSLRHGAIPPTLHFNGGNPAIRFGDGPFAVNTAPLPWTERKRAAISSFGFSGTNALVVVEAPPVPPAVAPQAGPQLFVLSARTPELLRAQAEDLAAHVERHAELSPADVAWTLATGRRHLRHRLALTAETLADLAERLRRWLAGDADSGVLSGEVADSPLDTIGGAEAFIAGGRPTAPAQGRRVPLPVTRFAAIRCWVEAAAPQPAPTSHPVPAPQPAARTLPLRLADPVTLAGPFAAAAATRVTLAPLSTAPALGGVERLGDANGVRRLHVTGDGAGLAGELSAAAADEAVRVVLIEGEVRLTDALLDCPLPVVASTDAADFTGDTPEHAATLARQVAEAPRLALVELKRSMRRAAIPQAAVPWPLAEAPSPGPARMVPLTSQCMSLEAFADGVVVLRMAERQHKNSFTDIFMDGLAEAFAAIARLDGAKVVVLTGFDGYFACGGTRDGLEQLQQGATRFTDRTIYSLPLECPLPVIAAMQGHAIGAGWSLGMFCDLQLFAAEAIYHSNYLWYGFTPGAGATLVFPHRLGDRLGREVLFTAHEYRGRELAARRPSLRVVAAAAVLPTALSLAHGLAQQPRETLLALKAEAARPLLERLPATFARELAMHDKTFIGNPRVQERIERMFPAAAQPVAPAPASASSRDAVRAQVVATLAEDLMIPATDIRDSAGFLELGLDSILAVTWIRRLNSLLGVEMPATAIYAHPTVGALIDHLAGKMPAPIAAPVPPAAPSGRNAVRARVVATLAEDLMIPAADIRDGAGFLELGLDSILAVTWIRRLNSLLGVELPATAIYAHPTVGALIDHLAGKMPVPIAAPVPPAAPSGRDAVRARVVASLAEDLMIPAADIRDGAGFLELGLDSILAVTWIRRLNSLLGVELPATAIYAHPTVGALIDHLASKVPAPAPAPAPMPAPAVAPAVIAAPIRRDRTARSAADAVAIIGASGRFPRSPDLEAFWDNIRSGRDCIDEVPPSRWDVARFYHPDPLHPGTSSCKWMGVIDDIDRFDAAFFNITPREAELMDPQQRLFLQHAWQAFEDAALAPSALGGSRCGVFVGAGPSGYGDLIDEHNAYSLLGCSGSILAARIAHLLDLRGPCISLDTACSSSLVAIAEACNSLLVGDSDLALAGGVSVMIGPEMFIDTSKVNMLSKDGRCFTFDSRANGFVPGEGAAVLLLKRLEDAERDGDPIHAVIRGWGVNQDGRTNGITAPNPQAQTRLIREVQQRFGIAPASIGMVECHGTGTPLGDPIEIEGLTDAFAGLGDRPGSVALGSVKSNMGHLLAAAGVAGALKAMLAVERAELPPTIQFEQMNEHINLTGTPFMVNTALRPWNSGDTPRRAAVSAFGFSGTNAHLVVESAPVAAPGRVPGPWVFPLSARNRDRLADMAGVLERFVAARPDLDLGDVAHTLQVGRKSLRWRAAFACSDRATLLRALAALAAGQPFDIVTVSDTEPQIGTALSASSRPAAQLADAWAKGAKVEWSGTGRRLHLPGTVFARDRHWVEAKQAAAPVPAVPHEVLPAWSLPELARAAAERDGGPPVRALRHLVWGRPPAAGARLETVIDRDDMGRLFRVVADGAEWEPCAVGEVADTVPPAPDPIALPTGGDATDAFHRFAPEAGAVRAVWRHGPELFARVVLSTAPAGFDPAALDLGWRLAAFAAGGETLHPQAAESIAAHGTLPAEFLVRVWTRPGAAHPSIALLDQQGVTRLSLDGLRTAPFSALADILLGENTAS